MSEINVMTAEAGEGKMPGLHGSCSTNEEGTAKAHILVKGDFFCVGVESI
jgi:hypothetical protein